MAYQTILVSQEDHIYRLTMNRPDRLNALNPTMNRETVQALDEISRDREARVLILTGAGRGFCAGGDMSGDEQGEDLYRAPTAESRRLGLREGPPLIVRKLAAMEIPTIAMVNGAAVGAGFDVALACDLRVGSPAARFQVAFLRMGAVPATGGCWLLPRIMGLSQAARYLFTADFLGAEEAHRLGVLDQVAPAEQLEAVTLGLAQRIASGPPIAVKLAKLLLYKGLDMTFDASLEMAAACATIAFASEDFQEGVAAFRERRQAVFKGR